MTANESTVTVYSYRTLNDEHPEIPQPSRFKATRSAIARMGGVILEGTEQEVDADELDAHGRYRRIATGWGELA